MAHGEISKSTNLIKNPIKSNVQVINFTFVCLLKFALTSVSSESTWKPTQLWQRFILTLQLHIVREECCQQNWKQFASENNFLCRLLVETSSSKLESSVQTFWQYCVWKCQDNTSLETKIFLQKKPWYKIPSEMEIAPDPPRPLDPPGSYGIILKHVESNQLAQYYLSPPSTICNHLLSSLTILASYGTVKNTHITPHCGSGLCQNTTAPRSLVPEQC